MRQRNIIFGVIIGVLILAAIGLLIAWLVQGHPYGPGIGMMRNWQRGAAVWGPGFMARPLVGLACLVGLALFAGLVWSLATLGRGHKAEAPRQQPPQEESALEILKRRYARGEITQEEYERIKQELT